MKNLELNQMENVQGGSESGLCEVAFAVGISFLVGTVTGGIGGVFVASILSVYASNAFC